MAYKSIPAEQAYRIGMLVERSVKLRAQADALAMQAQLSMDRARQMMAVAGLIPDLDELVTDETSFQGKPVPIGTVVRQGKPVEEPSEPANG